MSDEFFRRLAMTEPGHGTAIRTRDQADIPADLAAAIERAESAERKLWAVAVWVRELHASVDGTHDPNCDSGSICGCRLPSRRMLALGLTQAVLEGSL